MTWWRDPAKHAALRKKYGSSGKAALALGGISERQAMHWWARMVAAGAVDSSGNATDVPVPIGKPGGRLKDRDPDGDTLGGFSTVTENRAKLIGAANPQGTKGKTPEEMLSEHGLDPAEWDYRVSATSWDAPVGDGAITTLHRIKVDAIRRADKLLEFDVPGDWKPPRPRTRRASKAPRRIALFSDPHFPLHEPSLYEASLAWLEEHQPDRIVCLGDEGDWSPFKRHRKNMRTDTTVNEAVWGVYEGLAGWRNAAPNAAMELIPGNHTTWLQSRILEMFPSAALLTPPGDDRPLISMRNILKLDDLRIEYHEATGEYHDSVIEIAPGLTLMHGTKTGKGGGAAKEQAGWEGTSVVQGHDHQLVLTTVNKRTPNGGHTQRYAVSAGTMAKRDLGYSPTHDCGQGFPVITIHDCGRWHVDLALYDPVDGSTTWRDWIYRADPAG